MRCPFCNFEDTQVRDSRPTEDNYTIRRRRHCPTCNARFTTFERIQLRELFVVKKTGEIKPFDRDKIFSSITIATRKRDISADQIETIVNDIVRTLELSGDTEIPSNKIGELVMEALACIDQVAYVRFASVYRDFCEAGDFKNFVEDNIKQAK